MNVELENTIKILLTKIDADVDGNEAMKYTQAALNLSHVHATLSNTKIREAENNH